AAVASRDAIPRVSPDVPGIGKACMLWRRPNARMGAMPDPARYSAVELLRDGRRVEIRALKAGDRPDFLAAIDRTSAGSLYRRFFSVRRYFTPQEVAFFLN